MIWGTNPVPYKENFIETPIANRGINYGKDILFCAQGSWLRGNVILGHPTAPGRPRKTKVFVSGDDARYERADS